MKPGQKVINTDASFEDTVKMLKEQISAAGMLLISEINTQEILQKHGISINGFRQLLFFHPGYMKTLLSIDAHAAIEVPLKVVVRECGSGKAEIWFNDVMRTLGEYQGMDLLAHDLQLKISAIVSERQ